MVAAPLLQVGLEEVLRDAAERRAPRGAIAVAEGELQVGHALGRRAGEDLVALVHPGDEALAGRGIDLRLEPARDRREERVVLGARYHDAAPLAAAQVHVDLP